MKRINFITVLCVSILSTFAMAKPSRTLVISETEIGEIRTAIGYSTILQFDSRPVSVVVGDQDSFKVEYVGNSLTLKPVTPGTRTNMFVFTGYDRFSFKIATGRSDIADYFVEVKRKRAKDNFSALGIDVAEVDSPSFDFEGSPTPSSKMSVQTINRKTKCGGISLTIDSISVPAGKPWLVIAFSLNQIPPAPSTIDFQGNDVFLTRGKKVIPFETLYLESLKLPEEGIPVRGSLLVSNRDSQSLSGTMLNFAPAIFSQKHCRVLKLLIKATPKPTSPSKKTEGKANESTPR